ncbi:MAG: ammonia-forming cytochrome c nitrite reductase subunit c552 [Kiritimatiellales bacterium]|nr:ammonia-forming cytochrome c nitrite reductase subunit c552 [Kiritimatiellales bacterium]MCF7863624.1 ammonia-forming cytochrome c nitrite reductase subunit c552 [Kiritimatiellales bacterium]
MKKQYKQTHGAWKVMATVAALLGLGVSLVQAAAPRLPNVKINARPLTPQEITDYSLPASTQTASGNPVVGLGQPVYLEFLVEKEITTGTSQILPVEVTQVAWSLDSVVNADNEAIASFAVITNSPLGLAIPTYDVGDQNKYYVIDRAVIVPDVRGTYAISLEATTASNGMFNAGFEVVGSAFLGKDYTACTLCHASKQAGFNATGHATALERKINDPSGHFNANCISCHALGYDKTPGAVNSGFDDVAADLGWTFPPVLGTNNWGDMPLALQQKSNVQCENCHGPAQEHMRTGGDTGKIGVSFSAGNCSQCHDKKTHHVKSTEWKTTLHANGYVFRTGSCAPCHSAEGYIDANDPSINEFGETNTWAGATSSVGITCAACHDPHSPGAGAHQLRTIASVTLSNGEVINQGGDGLTCMACHHDRRDAEVYVLTNNGGPHHGTQTDMMFGKNAIEYGQNMPSSKHWDVVADTCAQCHMQETPATVPAYAKNKVGGHTFMLAYNDGTNAVVHLTETCKSCHGEIEDFNFGGEDYDQDGTVEGVQQEIADMLNDLAMLLPPYGTNTVDKNQISKTSDADLGLRKGVYNYLFVTEDGSLGVHNPKYAAALLRSSIDDLKGGIDVDRDGLADAWEIENFGNLTSQSGADDYDGDGLTNIEEHNLGTNPTLADSDGDGFSDLVEVQGNSNPLQIASVPAGDLVMIQAAELAYLPKSSNTTVRFQALDSLTTGSWTNIGPAQVNSGNWVYQLESMRTNGNNRFFRAIEE